MFHETLKKKKKYTTMSYFHIYQIGRGEGRGERWQEFKCNTTVKYQSKNYMAHIFKAINNGAQ